MKTKKVVRKSTIIRYSGRSTDFISPSFIDECGLDCKYCYVKRHGKKFITVATNLDDIFASITQHTSTLGVKEPNQTHKKYWTYDIACNSDFAFHRKQLKWKEIFDYFVERDNIMASLATKVIPTSFLDYNPKGKVRIRFSLMPQSKSTILEPHTPKIIDRIKAINDFKEAGYDVHINFSPVILYEGWDKEYRELFELCNEHIKNEYKNSVLSEVIFLTHNEGMHLRNKSLGFDDTNLLWVPELQENKVSQFGGKNVRYKRELKQAVINQFKMIHDDVINWNTIRYIF